jgi:hypothetical protein
MPEVRTASGGMTPTGTTSSVSAITQSAAMNLDPDLCRQMRRDAAYAEADLRRRVAH